MSAQALTVVDNAPRSTRIAVSDPIPVLDTGRFEQMYRIAKLMAASNLIPETLCATYEGTGANRVTKWLPVETVTANCFLIVNQAVGWNMDPFAVAQCASVVHGRVCYEGKLIAAVLDQRAGVSLYYAWDNGVGDNLGITVSGTLPGETEPRVIKGTVGAWKTTSANSPWSKQPRLQLAYRGAREWARVHKPAVILGVYSDDELEAATQRQERRPPSPSVVVVENAAQEARKVATPAIEHKPAVAVVEEKREPIAAETQRRRPPTPPQGIAEGTINEAQGFPGYKLRIVKMLNDAPDAEACDKVFEAMVTKHMGKLKAHEYEELSAALESRLREFEPQMVWGE